MTIKRICITRRIWLWSIHHLCVVSLMSAFGEYTEEQKGQMVGVDVFDSPAIQGKKYHYAGEYNGKPAWNQKEFSGTWPPQIRWTGSHWVTATGPTEDAEKGPVAAWLYGGPYPESTWALIPLAGVQEEDEESPSDGISDQPGSGSGSGGMDSPNADAGGPPSGDPVGLTGIGPLAGAPTPQVTGAGPEQGDPVNVLNGAMNSTKLDVAIPCPGISLEFARCYNSGSTSTGAMGPNWTHSYEWSLAQTTSVEEIGSGSITNDCLKIRTGDGSVVSPLKVTNDLWQSYREVNWTVRFTNGEYIIYMPERRTCTFDSNGVLIRLSGMWSNVITLAYSNTYPNHVLTNAHHNNGQYLAFAYQDGRLTSVATPSPGLGMTYAYNATGELTNATLTTSTRSYTSTYSYDAADNHSLTQIVDAAGYVHMHGFASTLPGEIRPRATNSLTDSTWLPASFSYETNNYLARMNRYRGSVTQAYTYSYNPTNLRIHTSKGPGVTNAFLYDWTYLIITNEQYISDGETYELHRGFDYGLNITNMGVAYNGAPSNHWSYSWNRNDNWHLLTDTVDAEGHRTVMEYTNNEVSRLKQYFNDAESYDTSFTYATNGLVESVTNASGHFSSYYYNELGFVTSVVPQAGPWARYQCHPLGYVTNITTPGVPGERVTGFDVDEIGLVHRVVYPDGLVSSNRYDALNNLITNIDRGSRITSLTYHPTRKLASTIRVMADGSQVTNRFEYDSQFNGLRIFDGLDRPVESYVLDMQERVNAVTNLEGQTMSLRYGFGKFVKGVTRFDGSIVSNIYNTEGLLQETRYPGTTNQFTYYRDKVLKTASNELGTIANFYNGCDWLLTNNGVGPNSTISYTYFPAGNVSSVVSAAGTYLYGYDEAERLTNLTHAGQVFEPIYASNGLMAQTKNLNSGIRVTNSFDIMNRLTSRVWLGATGNVLRSFAYQFNAVGMITNETLADGSILGYSYDNLDRLTGEKKTVGGTTEYDVAFSYDKVGNRQTKSRSGITVSYGYQSGCNRLLSWNATSANDFDSLRKLEVSGNILDASGAIGTNPSLGQLYVSNGVAMVVPAVSVTNFSATNLAVGYGSQNIIAVIGDPAGNTAYATSTITTFIPTNGTMLLDAAGCVTQMVTIGTGGFSNRLNLAWNGRYEVTSISTGAVVAETATYDVMGRRVSIGANGETNYLVYAGAQCVAEVGATGDVKRTYTYSTGIDNILAMTTYTGGVTNVYYYLTDHLGTVHAVANSAGTIVESYSFDAWGGVLSVRGSNNQELATSAIGNRYLWQGREYSWATGLYNFRARWYDPITGRWLSNDPIGISGGLNQYVFCKNNPVNKRDPTGRCEEDNTPYDLLNPPASPAPQAPGPDRDQPNLDITTTSGSDIPDSVRDLAPWVNELSNLLTVPLPGGGEVGVSSITGSDGPQDPDGTSANGIGGVWSFW